MRDLRAAIVSMVAFTALTGVAYPLAVTGIAQLAMPHRANGSIIERDGRPVASELLGQRTADPKYFWGRPSGTSPDPYSPFNAEKGTGSSGSNLGPLSADLKKNVADQVTRLREADRGNTAPIPVDLVMASGSGLDPEISPAAAYFQAKRVADLRQRPEKEIRDLIAAHLRPRTLGVLGEPRVNVVELNLALDALR